MSEALPDSRDLKKASELKRIRLVASSVLMFLALVFLATHFLEQTVFIRLMRAMAEAGMVGGIADWFAVEALFRRPLGLPIPHTALLPKNQKKAAENIGRFFETHFLEPSQVRARIADLKPTHRMVDWLKERENAHFIAGYLTEIISYIIKTSPPPKLLAKTRKEIEKALTSPKTSQAIADSMVPLIKQGVRGGMVGHALTRISNAIDRNRDKVTELVQDRSRWWIATSVDRRVSKTIVDGVISVLEDVAKEGSPLRADFENAFDSMIEELAKDGSLIKAIDGGKQHFISSGAIETATAKLTTAIRERIQSELERNPEKVTELIADGLQKMAHNLHDDPVLLEKLEERFSKATEDIVASMRPEISKYVTDVIAGWDAKLLIERFEGEIGPDLQFIRINGAVLGSLIGGAIFGVNFLLSAH